MLRTVVVASIFAPAFIAPTHLVAQQATQEVEIASQEVAPGIYMLTGQGGNMGLAVGPDATFLIDDQYAPLTDKITTAVAELTERPVDFVVNTHWHGDHTGGNENLGKAGALIVAHENVRERMSTDQFIELFNMRSGPAPEVALPAVTFGDAVTFHLNGETIRVRHLDGAAHTDGDSVVFFENANVVHLGDTMFHGMYPFIDVGTGGTVDGMIRNADHVLAMTDDETRIIPGHGPVASRADLEASRDMMIGVRDAVAALVAAGHDRDAVVAAKPTAPWDEAFGGGFLGPDIFAGIAYDSAVATAATDE